MISEEEEDHVRIYRPAQASLACALLEAHGSVVVALGREGSYLVYKSRDPHAPIVVAGQRNGCLYSILAAFPGNALRRLKDMLERRELELNPNTKANQHRIWMDRRTGKGFVLEANEQEEERTPRALGRELAWVLRPNRTR